MKTQLGKLTFKLAGWKYQGDKNILEDKQVLIGFEHTSMMDGVLSLALFQIYQIKIHILMKKNVQIVSFFVFHIFIIKNY